MECRRIKLSLPLILFLFHACQGAPDLVLDHAFEMDSPKVQESHELAVAPKTVAKERRDFIEKLMRTGKDKRPLYEAYLDVIGANGILAGIEEVWPRCHAEAHDAGRVIFARVRDLGSSLRICTDRCATGCMHGVLTEAFAGATDNTVSNGQVNLGLMMRAMHEGCYKNAEMVSSRPGNCAHGIGHALMVHAQYNIPEAIEACAGFPEPAMRYYCATGAYMEYVTEYDTEDAKSKSLHYPCDTYDYPAACSRYKMYYVAQRYYKANRSVEDLVHECATLTGKFRLGCFHGLGNAHMWLIASGQISIKSVCGHGTDDERFMCLEGAMERMGQYYEKTALAVCEQLEGQDRQVCFTAVENKMYNMKKDYTLYLGKE